jgi:hypothetical protein
MNQKRRAEIRAWAKDSFLYGNNAESNLAFILMETLDALDELSPAESPKPVCACPEHVEAYRKLPPHMRTEESR